MRIAVSWKSEPFNSAPSPNKSLAPTPKVRARLLPRPVEEGRVEGSATDPQTAAPARNWKDSLNLRTS
jgi:hypothetical protein